MQTPKRISDDPLPRDQALEAAVRITLRKQYPFGPTARFRQAIRQSRLPPGFRNAVLEYFDRYRGAMG